METKNGTALLGMSDSIKLAAALNVVFGLIVDRDYWRLDNPVLLYDDPDDFKTDYANAVSDSLEALGIAEPAGDSLDWLGEIHDMLEEARPLLASGVEAFCGDSFSPAAAPREDEIMGWITAAIAPSAKGYDGGYRDALQSTVLGMRGVSLNQRAIGTVVQTAIDAFGNNAPGEDEEAPHGSA